jgi:hypothetical protein
LCKKEFVPTGQTVNSRFNCDVLRRLRENVRRCRPKLLADAPGCFTMTLLSSPSSFWWKTKWLSSPTHWTPLIWHPVTASYFQKCNWSWKDAGLIPLTRYRPNCRVRGTLTEKDFQEALQKWRRWDRCLHVGGNHFEGDSSW